MGYIEGQSRAQISLFPDSIDQYITEENPVRVIDAFVDSLDLNELGFDKAQPKAIGRPPYHPATLLKLYIYGYLNRVRSSRLLEQESQRNIEVMWLLARLTPDFKTLADFRKANGPAIRQSCRAFTLLCREVGLYGQDIIAIDGSHFKAVNSRERNFTKRKLQTRLQALDDKIEYYLQQLAQHDEEDAVPEPSLPAEQIQTLLEKLKTKRNSYIELSKQMEETGSTQISLTDPDARYMMKRRSGKSLVGYNVQTAVDGKHKLIIDFDISNEPTDKHQLDPMTQRAQTMLEQSALTVLADAGYFNGEQIRQVVDSGAIPYVSSLNTSSNASRGLYGKERFHYNREEDCYLCPAGETLPYRYQSVINGNTLKHYETLACNTCSQRPQCTWRKKGPRRVSRRQDEDILEQMEQRKRENPTILPQRKCIVEHPFGTMKRTMNQGYFLMKRLANVKTEMSLTVLAYNLKRAMNILGAKELMRAMA